MSNNVRHLVGTNGLFDDLAEFEASLLSFNLVGHELALDVPKQSEVLASPINADYVHEAEGVLSVSPDLSINFDEAFLVFANLDDFLVGKSILQSLSK